MTLDKNISYSLNDHYKWGFNGDWFNEPKREGYFQVSIGACSRPHLSFREECINSAKILGSKFTKPIMIGLSGGFDSQVVCLSFLNANVEFTPVILHLKSETGETYNHHDLIGAYEFCNKFNLTPISEELNLDRFFYETAPYLIEKYCITVAEISVQLYLIDKYKATHAYVNGGGDPQLHADIDLFSGTSRLTYSLMPTPIEQYLIDNKIEGCVKFFMFAPEQIASYLNHPVMNYYSKAYESINSRSNTDYFVFCIKPLMYLDQWPELIHRKKNTGFEKITYFNKVRQMVHKMNEYINPRSKKVTWTYQEILSHLLSNTGEIKTWRSDDERDYY